MSSKFGLKFSGFDVVIGVISVVLAILLLLVNSFLFPSNISIDDKVAFIYYEDEELDEYTVYFKDLKDDEVKEIILLKSEYPSLLADMVILVSKSECIRVKEEESPLKICSEQGWVNSANIPVVCLPNSVYIIIKDLNKIDFDITLE